jgi:hypothetical protein
MQQSSTQMKELETIVAELPTEKVQELLDFAYYLHQRYTPHPQRGSATAILDTLQEVGALQFEEGELDALLADIEARLPSTGSGSSLVISKSSI